MLNALWQRFGGLIVTLIALALVALLVIVTINSARDRDSADNGSDNNSLVTSDSDTAGDSDGPAVTVVQNDENDDDAVGSDINVAVDDPDASSDDEGVVVASDDPDTDQGETLEGSVAQSTSQDEDSSSTGSVAGTTDSTLGGSSSPTTLPATGPGRIIASITAVVVGVAGGYWMLGRRELAIAAKKN